MPLLSGLMRFMSRRKKIANLPNLLTALRIALAPIFLVTVFSEVWYAKGAAFVIFALASLTDFYDGRLARAGNQVTAVGRFLDPLADKILVTSALIALVYDHLVDFWLVVPIVVRDLFIMGLRTYGLARGRQMVTSQLAKWKTALQLFTVVILLFLISAQETMKRFAPDVGFPLAFGHIRLIANGLVAAILLFTVLSGLQYLLRGRFVPRGVFSRAEGEQKL